MYFANYSVMVKDKDGKVYEYSAENLGLAYGYASLYKKLGFETWIDPNLRKRPDMEKVKKEIRLLEKILEEETSPEDDEEHQDLEPSVDFEEMY